MMSLQGHDGDQSDATHAIKYRSINDIAWFGPTGTTCGRVSISLRESHVKLFILSLFLSETQMSTKHWIARVSTDSVLGRRLTRYLSSIASENICSCLFFCTTIPRLWPAFAKRSLFARHFTLRMSMNRSRLGLDRRNGLGSYLLTRAVECMMRDC